MKKILSQDKFKEKVCNGKAHYEEDIRTGQLTWIKSCNCKHHAEKDHTEKCYTERCPND
jgi:hypothetical protein